MKPLYTEFLCRQVYQSDYTDQSKLDIVDSNTLSYIVLQQSK